MADLFCLMDTIEGAEGQQFPAVLLIITKAKHALKKHGIYHGTIFLHIQEPTVMLTNIITIAAYIMQCYMEDC